MKYSVEEILPGVIHFRFRSHRTMVKHFLRFQEYWEHPIFKNKIFTAAQYKAWHQSHHDHDIYMSWDGCAMSSRAFYPFFEGRFNVSSEERSILRDLRSYRGCKFFVITSVGNDPSTMMHEVAHALFHTNYVYRSRVLSILSSSLTKSARLFLNKKLRNMGYDESRFDDELHAYLIEGLCRFTDLTGQRRKYTASVRKQFKGASSLLKKNLRSFVGPLPSKSPSST